MQAGISRTAFFDAKEEIGIQAEPVKNAAGKVTGWINWVSPYWIYLNQEYSDSGTVDSRKVNDDTNLDQKNQSINPEYRPTF